MNIEMGRKFVGWLHDETNKKQKCALEVYNKRAQVVIIAHSTLNYSPLQIDSELLSRQFLKTFDNFPLTADILL